MGEGRKAEGKREGLVNGLDINWARTPEFRRTGISHYKPQLHCLRYSSYGRNMDEAINLAINAAAASLGYRDVKDE